MIEVALGVLLDPGPLVVVDHRAAALLEHPAGAGVDHDQACVAQVAAVAPARAADVAVPLDGELAQDLLAVVDRLHALQQLVLLVGRGGEVAEVLVDPVGHQRPDDVLLPPVGGMHLLEPGGGDVPVVVHVVVVEDHRGGHGREQPADRGLGPALAVELRVLVEVEHPLARRVGRIAACLDEGAGGGRDLVGVDLVADHQQHVGPALAVVAGHLPGHRVQRVHLAATLVVVLGEREGRLVRRRDPAGPEHQLKLTLLRVGAKGAGREG